MIPWSLPRGIIHTRIVNYLVYITGNNTTAGDVQDRRKTDYWLNMKPIIKEETSDLWWKIHIYILYTNRYIETETLSK